MVDSLASNLWRVSTVPYIRSFGAYSPAYEKHTATSTLTTTQKQGILEQLVFDAIMQEITQNIGHSPLVCCSSIFQTKGHNFIAKYTFWCSKGCQFFIFGSRIVPVNERQHCMVDSVINQYINDGKRVIILETGLVQIYVVYTSLPSHLSSPLALSNFLERFQFDILIS